MVKLTFTSLLLILCFVIGAVDEANAQIRHVAKERKFVYQGAITEPSEHNLALRLQCRLTYSVQGDNLQFTDGGLTYYVCDLDGKSTQTLFTFEISQTDQLVKYIQLLDELYATPLEGSDSLELDLKPSQSQGEMSYAYVGDVFEIRKNADGYQIWSSGYTNDYIHPNGWGPLFESVTSARGWWRLDLTVFRETLRACGQASQA